MSFSAGRFWVGIVLAFSFVGLPGGAKEGPDQVSLEILISPTHHLYYLLESLIDEPHRSPQMAATFRSRVGDWSPVQEALDLWKRSRESDDLSGLRLPKREQRSANLGDVLERVALDSSDAGDMTRRVQPWLGPEHSGRLGAALETLEPLQRRLWWNQSLPNLQRRKDELLQQLARGDFSTSLAHAQAFFVSDLDPLDPPRLALLPYQKGIGEDKSLTRGHSQGGLQVLEVVVDKPDPDAAGTVFHEFMHHLWMRQSPPQQERWEKAFQQHGAWGRTAYVQLNEGLATALGNGWFAQRVTGRTDQGSWYADPVIEAYGRALYPIVSVPLEQRRPPSDAELDQMVMAFRQAVPDALTRFDVVAADFGVISSRPEIEQAPFQMEIMRLGPVRWSRTRSWDDKPSTSTFQVYWIRPDERTRLATIGWKAQPFESYSLRQTRVGWQLAFIGEPTELFVLLRKLAAGPLRPSSD